MRLRRRLLHRLASDLALDLIWRWCLRRLPRWRRHLHLIQIRGRFLDGLLGLTRLVRRLWRRLGRLWRRLGGLWRWLGRLWR